MSGDDAKSWGLGVAGSVVATIITGGAAYTWKNKTAIKQSINANMTALINKLRTAEQQAGVHSDHLADQLEQGAMILEAVRDHSPLVHRTNGAAITPDDVTTAAHVLQAVDQVDDAQAAKLVSGIKADAHVKALVESILKKAADNGGKIILRAGH